MSMKKAVGINEVSKEELYDLYLKLLKRNEKLEAKFLAMQMELGEKNRRLEECNFQLAKRNRIIFGRRRRQTNRPKTSSTRPNAANPRNRIKSAMRRTP